MKSLLLAIALFIGCATFAQSSASADKSKTSNASEMKTYVIERDVPGAGRLNAAELKSMSQTSCGVLKEMGSVIQWMHSYVTGNKIFCVYKAKNEELIREHAKKGGFPVTSINEVENVISPATAE